MNTLLLSVLALLATTNMALGFACTENFCNLVKCKALTEENCAYTVVPNGGSCGCCAACVRFLKEGEDCPTLLLMGGPPPTVRCGDRLVCNRETGKCEAVSK